MKLREISEGISIIHNKTWLMLALFLFLFCISVLPLAAYADINQAQTAIVEQQQRDLKNSLTPPLKHARMDSQPVALEDVDSSDDSSCLVIKRVELINTDAFSNAARLMQWARQAQGLCLGEAGLSALQNKLQGQMVADGYITSHVTFIEDSYVAGTLSLALIPGNLSGIEHHEDSHGYAQLNTVFPSRQGDVVNLRHLEQGLENLQRLPSVNATMDVVLNREDLSSQIVVKRQQARFWRINAFLDDAGHYAIGRYRAGATVFLDNPLSLSDLLYFSASRDLDNHHDKGNHYLSLHYSIPLGNWLLSATWIRGMYYQTSLISGSIPIKYLARWQRLDMQIQRLLMRGNNYKTVISTGALVRKSNNFIFNTEIESQRVNTVDWQLGLQHLHYFPWGTLTGGITYQQGTNWLGARPTPGPSSKLMNLTAALNVPFTLADHRFYYQPTFSQQYTDSNLAMQDNFSIGGRNSVRGFPANSTLMGAQGWFLKNDFVWLTPQTARQFYIGLDYGEVNEKRGPLFLGERLIGSTVGVRGNYHQFGYDFNLGVPLAKPKKLNADPIILGFSINWQY